MLNFTNKLRLKPVPDHSGGAADCAMEGATSGRPSDDVVDADFELVDDDKKKS